MLETSPSVTRPVDEIATSVPMRSAMKAGRLNATSQVSVAFRSVNSRYARAGARATRSSRENAVEGFTRLEPRMLTRAPRVSRGGRHPDMRSPQLCSRLLDRSSLWIAKCKQYPEDRMAERLQHACGYLMRPSRVRLSVALLACVTVLAVTRLAGEPVAVRHTEGIVHGFLALRTLDGKTVADGDLIQLARGGRVTSRLVFRFKDGSV